VCLRRTPLRSSTPRPLRTADARERHVVVVHANSLAEASRDTSAALDEVSPVAAQHRVEDLPGELLIYTLASRYCLSDMLSDAAVNLFGTTPLGWERVQAVCDWVHGNVRFDYAATRPDTTSVDVFEARVGVCREFAHLAISFCRALNIPARYVFGYLPDIDVPSPPEAMDFWVQVVCSV
jgi:transglutaminase-like putative cysteine protease